MTEWVMVPREPTAAQLVDGAYEIPDPISHRGELTARLVYRAMLDAAPAMTDAQMEAATLSDEAADERAHAAYLRGIDEGKRQCAAPQQTEPVAQIGWADEFGNLFPMGAWKPAQRTHHDSHKTAWRPVFLHPPAAEVQQVEPVAWREHVEQRLRAWKQPHINRSGDQLALDDFMGACDIDNLIDYVCDEWADPPPAAEVQRLRNSLRWAIREIERSTCTHEETHRGGAIWTICDHCDSKWADDEGGFVPYVEPPELIEARAALEGVKP